MILFAYFASEFACIISGRRYLQEVQQIQSNSGAFAAIRSDGRVVTFGDADSGGDSCHLEDELRDVEEIQASHAAFAAIRRDRTVVTWGHAGCLGGFSCFRMFPIYILTVASSR